MTSCFKVLLENKANVKLFDRYGSTALHFACRRGNIDICRMILEPSQDAVDAATGVNRDPVNPNVVDNAKVSFLVFFFSKNSARIEQDEVKTLQSKVL